MAHTEQDRVTEFVLTLSEDEAALLRGVLANVVIADKNFSDDADGEEQYDDLSSLLVGIFESLTTAGAAPTYDTFDFEIV